MRRRPLLLSAFLFLLFLGLLYARRDGPVPSLVYAEGEVRFATGRILRSFRMDGTPDRGGPLPSEASRLLSFDGRMAFQERGSRRLFLHAEDGSWEPVEPPPGTSGEGVWTAGEGRLYYLQIRPAAVFSRALTETTWKDFIAEGEEVENPVDLAWGGTGILLLNQDPAEAVAFDREGRIARRFELTRDKIWPLQRPVFEAPLDYLRPRRCETPRRIWGGPDDRLAVMFTTEDGTAPRLVALLPAKDGKVVLKEGLLALRSEGHRREAVLGDFAFLPDGRAVITSNQGGLWLHNGLLGLAREWEPLPPSAPVWRQRVVGVLPWVLLAGSLLALAASAWPQRDMPEWPGTIPPRAWVMAAVSLVLPGSGQAIQRRWGWALFHLLWAVGWALFLAFLTVRLKTGAFVTPATYIETVLALAASGVASGAQAFRWEWNRMEESREALPVARPGS